MVFGLIVILSLFSVGNGQGCSNTCPPLNFGKPVKSLCEGDDASDSIDVTKSFDVCYPTEISMKNFRWDEFKGAGKITVIGNYYTGCNAGRRESGVFAHVAQRLYNEYGNRVTFIQSVKGGGTCWQWAKVYQVDAVNLYPNSNVVPKEMPLSVYDSDYVIRDDFFTTPFGHPSYVILDGSLTVRHKFIGPCCGYESYYDCPANIAKVLDTDLTKYINGILAESSDTDNPSFSPSSLPTTENINTDSDQPSNSPLTIPSMLPTTSTVPSQALTDEPCQVGAFSEWSVCSVKCGTVKGQQFRWRTVSSSSDNCPTPVEIKSCQPYEASCNDVDYGNCIPEFGQDPKLEVVSTGFQSPRDVAFHPSPGLHLGNYSEGRIFHPHVGEEAWVVNSGNHSISIVASLGTEYQTTLSRRDRGYYHYMINGTALSFNTVNNSDRAPDRDGFNYWAICNDNLNTYLDTKEPNYFMGPTLYNSNPHNFNTVSRRGKVCEKGEPCYFLHSDMLHEAPSCVGIAHDPEVISSYGNVYWAFDATGNREKGQLVRFDFQQPHGPGSMDHSVASVRRYVEIELDAGDKSTHAGIVVHETRREVYVAVPGANKIIVVDADSGMYARTGREEYPIYSNRLPSFEYSIFECVSFKDFAVDIQTPTGLALSKNGEHLFVAERETGKILVFEVSTASLVYEMDTSLTKIGGLSFSPSNQVLHLVDEETNSLYSIQSSTQCTNPIQTRLHPEFQTSLNEAENVLGHLFFLRKDFNCVVNPIIPNATFFEQVHNDTGYASNITEGGNSMNPGAALLANRTDCEYDSELNFDALLLGGYFCHVCLPEQELTCDKGGQCANNQWTGYTCDNEYTIQKKSRNNEYGLQDMNGISIDPKLFLFRRGVTYRFTVSDNVPICLYYLKYSSTSKSRLLSTKSNPVCASNGPLLLTNIANDVNQVIFKRGEETVLALTSCSNDKEYRLQIKKGKNKRKNCNWVSGNKNRVNLCKKSEVRTACPISCGDCCMDDPTYKFNVKGQLKTCEWASKLGAKKKKRFCRRKQHKFNCAETCNRCF